MNHENNQMNQYPLADYEVRDIVEARLYILPNGYAGVHTDDCTHGAQTDLALGTVMVDRNWIETEVAIATRQAEHRNIGFCRHCIMRRTPNVLWSETEMPA
jgi:hypothetical protein